MARSTRKPTTGVVAYIRVSTSEQELSVEAQRTRLEAWCAERQFTLVAVHANIGVSGGADLKKRPGLMAALDALTSGLALVAVKRDRLARDAMNAAMIERLVERKGARVLTCAGEGEGDSPEAKLMRTMVDAFAEYERHIIGARTKTAMGHKRNQGERISRHVPYGKILSDDNLYLVDNPDELGIIAVARELHASGLSSRKVAAHLAARGLYNRNGRMFTPAAVLNMVAA